MRNLKLLYFSFCLFLCTAPPRALAQCGGTLEPGFAFLTSSRGCAPFTVNIQTLYLSSVPGTRYYVNWGDGTPEETYTQVGAGGVNLTHLYPNTSINCGYDVEIDASNACNPRGSVVPINTQVIVWTNDVIGISPATYRVCQGFAASVLFTDNSTWNCFPRATRENAEPRWIQWLYGTGSPLNQIPGIRINGILPGLFPYLNPTVNTNPIYPVLAPGQVSLPIAVPVTLPADVGKEFEITLKNWNQCNPYDNNILDGNPRNPVNGNLVNGDNAPQVIAARIIIVPAPQPTYQTRLGNAAGPVQTVFCIGDNIYFDNNTPNISGSSFQFTWQFYDNPTGTGSPLSTSNSRNPTFAYASSGQKLIRLSVRDQNAAGSCVAIFESMVTISPSLIARISLSDLSDNPLLPIFCQETSGPLTTFQVRVRDSSIGSIVPSTQWKWEFFNENNVLIRQEPTSGFSNVQFGPFDLNFINRGIYRVRLTTRDNLTSCETRDETAIRVFEKPIPIFNSSTVCEGLPNAFSENSTLMPTNGESIVTREWDFNYDGVTFDKDPVFDNQRSFARLLGSSGIYPVALRVTASQSGCSTVLVQTTVVQPLPAAAFSPDVTSGCSKLTVNFANQSVNGQPQPIDRYEWQVDSRGGAGFQTVRVQRPGDAGFSSIFTYEFENLDNINKTVDVRLRVISSTQCERISTPIAITIFPGTASGFSSPGYSPFNSNCSPVSVAFSVDSQTRLLNPASYRWQISDQNGVISDVSSGSAPTYSFQFLNNTNVLKDFQVKLITTLPSGCFGDSTRTIRISPVPVSDFEIDTLAFTCTTLKVRLTAAQKGLTSYRWRVAQNSVVLLNSLTSESQIEQTFSRLATDQPISFSLETRNFANCVSSGTSKNIVVPRLENLNAAFAITPAVQTLPNATVMIVNSTNPGPWNYLWDFGDGTTSTNPMVGSHTYKTFGKYSITLKVSSATCVETVTRVAEILAIPPIVDFEYAPPSGCIPLRVKFTNKSQFADPEKYVWEFGDGQATSKAIDPSYTYFEPGKYSVSLAATNATGQMVKVTKLLIIEAFPQPKADFDVKPRLVTIPGGILYTRNLSFDGFRYEWDFGDGIKSDSFEPTHQYTEEGLYTISLTTYNSFGCSNTAVKENYVKVEKGGQVLVPNAFSPGSLGGFDGGLAGGGDGKNDVFLPITRGAVEFELVVFNRWGELLFESRDATIGWDGTYNGKLCPQDVYVYRLTTAFENGQRLVRVGDINLIR